MRFCFLPHTGLSPALSWAEGDHKGVMEKTNQALLVDVNHKEAVSVQYSCTQRGR